MKKSTKFIGVMLVLAVWVIMAITGALVWETKVDMVQGIELGLGITLLVLGFDTLAGDSCDESEYDEYGDYIGIK